MSLKNSSTNVKTSVSYDAAGNRLSVTDASGHKTTFAYDSLYRLVASTNAENQTRHITYDALGNNWNNGQFGYNYDNTNRLEVVNGQSYSFDANDNLLRAGAMTNTFDAANRLVSAQQLTTTLQPIYNGVGDRVGQTVEALTTYFILDVGGMTFILTDFHHRDAEVFHFSDY
ncbi:MAG: hypothetical protein Fur0044_16880 [Anaerolineae bacterium]